MDKKSKVIAIVGPTASGKTSLSITLAKKFNGEIISADSRQVYRGLDLGTGKITRAEMGKIQHHLLDVIDASNVYTGADFAQDASLALTAIIERGKIPIIAGGTFFYLDLLRGKQQSAPVVPDEAFRASLAKLSNASLIEKLYQKDPTRASTIDHSNRRRLIRALEIVESIGTVPHLVTKNSDYDWLIIGINITRETLVHNIHIRLHERLKLGMIEEVRELHAQGISYQRLDDLGLEYRYIGKYLQGMITQDEMVAQLETKIRQFAKRQLTWLKRDHEIEWYDPENQSAIFQRVEAFLMQ